MRPHDKQFVTCPWRIGNFLSQQPVLIAS